MKEKKDIKEISEEFNVEETVGYVVSVVALKLKRKLNEILKEREFDISPEQFFVLGTLHWHGSMSLTNLATKTYKDNANITRMIDLMEKKQFVMRKRDPEDKRAVKLMLTERGKELYLEALEQVIEMRSLIAPGLEENQLLEYRDISLQIIKNLTEKD